MANGQRRSGAEELRQGMSASMAPKDDVQFVIWSLGCCSSRVIYMHLEFITIIWLEGLGKFVVHIIKIDKWELNVGT